MLRTFASLEVPYKLHYFPGQEQAVVIVPGSSGGMNQSLCRAVFDESVRRGFTTVSFEYPYFVRGEQASEGLGDLKEESETLLDALCLLSELRIRRKHVIGKSLGGIVACKVFAEDPPADWGIDHLTVLGLIAEDYDMANLAGLRVDVIQGEADRYGDSEHVRAFLAESGRSDIRVTGVKDATHSFRDSATDKEPLHEQEAVDAIDWS